MNVSGSDGTQFTPASGGGDSEQLYSVWWPEIKRPVEIRFVEELLRFGITVRRFRVWDWTRYEGTGGSDAQAPTNMLALSRDRQGLPLFMSFPHFLYGIETQIKNGVDGLTPTEPTHQSVFDIEPLSFNFILEF